MLKKHILPFTTCETSPSKQNPKKHEVKHDYNGQPETNFFI